MAPTLLVSWGGRESLVLSSSGFPSRLTHSPWRVSKSCPGSSSHSVVQRGDRRVTRLQVKPQEPVSAPRVNYSLFLVSGVSVGWGRDRAGERH